MIRNNKLENEKKGIRIVTGWLVRILLALYLIFASTAESRLLAQPPKEITNSIGMKLVLVPKGTFMMGSTPSEAGLQPDELQHQVTISRSFYIGVHEVTQKQYETVMDQNPSFFRGERLTQRDLKAGEVAKNIDSSNHPVEAIHWADAVEFCSRLSALPGEKKARRVYRLPTESEWEYACRAGSDTVYCFGNNADSLVDYAWFGNNSGSKPLDAESLLTLVNNDFALYCQKLLEEGCRTHPVGTKKPNAWGIYDMHGNVWEWCSDWYGEYPKGPTTDPVGPREGSLKVIRGNGWESLAKFCRAADRHGISRGTTSYSFGFRVAVSSSGVRE